MPAEDHVVMTRLPPVVLCCHRSVAESIPFDFSAAGFRDPQRAEENLACVRRRVSEGVAQTLLPLLVDCADPDAALNLFERLSEQASGEVLRLLDRNRYLIHYAVNVFAASQWLGETLIQNTDLFASFVRERGIDRVRSREEFHEHFARVRSRSFDTDISPLLARFKKREYVRIMLRDVLGVATLADTTGEISALSDMLIEEAVRECESALTHRYGVPQHKDSEGRLEDTAFTVLSLGKLGGNELNYSSDVDLLYLYGEGEDVGSASISNREFFIRLAQEVTEVLSRLTREGPVFRIDLRLRPQGSEGEPAVPLGQALRYYAQASGTEGVTETAGTAHDWELQALIKVRHSAGSQPLAREFIRRVLPFVYRGEPNFAAIETAMEALLKIKTHRRRAGASRSADDTIDVKLDRGGIRDIEFLVQCLQRVYGGAEPWLRSGGTLFSLQKLHDKNHISGKDFHQLTTGYAFLRKIEHRLQLRTGQQIHRLPTNERELCVLWQSVTAERANITGAEIVASIRERMHAVAEIYNRILHHEQQQQAQGEMAAELRLVPPAGEGSREQTYSQILSRLASDSPALYRLAVDTELGSVMRKNLYRFLSAACTSGERYASVIGAPESVERALPIFAHSDFLTDILVRHPEEIASVRGIATGPKAGSAELFGATEASDLEDRVMQFAAENGSEAMGLLRSQYRHRVFLVGAQDLLTLRNVYASLSETSAIADAVISASLKVARAPAQFAVLAFGRLGTREFDVLSDADLLFVRDESADSLESAKAAERIMELLGAYTRDGSVFPVDARLRPHGAEGELVVTRGQLESYFATEAQAWEALSYTKLRHICGEEELSGRVQSAVDKLSERYGSRPEFAEEVREMRSRLEASEPGVLNFKTSAGGFYDVDFIVAYLAIRNRGKVARSSQNIAARIEELRAAGLLGQSQADELSGAAELLRTVEHVVRLVDGRPRKFLPVSELALAGTEELVGGILGQSFPEGLEAELRRRMAVVRGVYSALLA